MMADASAIKTETTVKLETKAEYGSPMALDDVEGYEDAGELDLEFYNTRDANGQATSEDHMLLAKLPTYLWQAWDKVKNEADDEAVVEVGKLRVWHEPGRIKGTAKRKMRLLLNTTRLEHHGIPREYDLQSNTTGVDNFYVFSEEDVEEFKVKNKERKEGLAQGIPDWFLRDRNRRQTQPTTEPQPRMGRRQRREFMQRRSIPKRTAIVGRLREDLLTSAIENPETEYILNHRAREAVKPKQTLAIMDRYNVSAQVVQAGTSSGQNKFQNFVKAAAPLTRKEKAELRTARIPQDQLYDMLFALFKRYDYWSMKAIRAEVAQPETYLRTSLENIADLHKSGRFANTWSLKPENQNKADFTQAAAQAAPDAQIESDDDDEGDDDEGDVQMEDVPV